VIISPVWRATFGNVSCRAWRVWQRNADVWSSTWLVNFIPPLFEPILYILAFGIGMGSLIGSVLYQGQEIPYLRFMIPGVISVAIMFWAYFETTYSSFVRMYYQKTFDAIMATPLLPEDVIAGELLWGATKSVMAALIMSIIVGFFSLLPFPLGLVIIPVAILGGLLFASLGLITTALVPKIDTFNVPTFIFIFPMFLFSGTFFPIDILPPWATQLAMFLPLTHISFLIRGICLAETPPYFVFDLIYLFTATTIFAGLAIILMRRRLVR